LLLLLRSCIAAAVLLLLRATELLLAVAGCGSCLASLLL